MKANLQTKIIRMHANASDVLLILSVISWFSSSKLGSFGKPKSDEKGAQKLKMEKEEKEFRKKFKVSFFQGIFFI